MKLLSLLGLVLVAAACNGPDVKDGEIACGVNDICPPGFRCAQDGFCYRDPQNTDAVCGDGQVQGDETCDPPGSCPTSCAPDGNSCTTETLSGSAATCNVTCTLAPITTCSAGDACCPSGCDFGSDADCSATCGDGDVDEGETCDPISTCPASCSDGNSCTTDSTTGSVANCNVSCGHSPIVTCGGGPDGCCPGTCTNVNDPDCSASCGNGAIEQGETCDPPASCPASCDDDNACTNDVRTGNSSNCNVVCSHGSISTCGLIDGCCPAGCSPATDSDCSSMCGNGSLDQGETCDPPSSCSIIAMTCNDSNACTIDIVTGAASTCNVVCSHNDVGECLDNDGCCPPGCSSFNDNNCTPTTSCDAGVLMDGGLGCSGS